MYAESWQLSVKVRLFPFYLRVAVCDLGCVCELDVVSNLSDSTHICGGGDRLSDEIHIIRPRRKPWLLEWCGIA